MHCFNAVPRAFWRKGHCILSQNSIYALIFLLWILFLWISHACTYTCMWNRSVTYVKCWRWRRIANQSHILEWLLCIRKWHAASLFEAVDNRCDFLKEQFLRGIVTHRRHSSVQSEKLGAWKQMPFRICSFAEERNTLKFGKRHWFNWK